MEWLRLKKQLSTLGCRPLQISRNKPFQSGRGDEILRSSMNVTLNRDGATHAMASRHFHAWSQTEQNLKLKRYIIWKSLMPVCSTQNIPPKVSCNKLQSSAAHNTNEMLFVRRERGQTRAEIHPPRS